jgi:hypothetical protein
MSDQLPDLPPMGVSAPRIEQLRDTLLTKLETLANRLDPEDSSEESVATAEMIGALASAFTDLR